MHIFALIGIISGIVNAAPHGASQTGVSTDNQGGGPKGLNKKKGRHGAKGGQPPNFPSLGTNTRTATGTGFGSETRTGTENTGMQGGNIYRQGGPPQTLTGTATGDSSKGENIYVPQPMNKGSPQTFIGTGAATSAVTNSGIQGGNSIYTTYQNTIPQGQGQLVSSTGNGAYSYPSGANANINTSAEQATGGQTVARQGSAPFVPIRNFPSNTVVAASKV
jgi:hypothetical protein